MDSWNLSDSMMNEEVCVQIVFPMICVQRFVLCKSENTIEKMISELKNLDDEIKQYLDTDSPWVFDSKGCLLDSSQKLSCFLHQNWIQLFVC